MLLEELKKDDTIDAYIFIDGTRKIDSNFLTLANVAMKKADAVTGEVNISSDNLDIIDRIKAVYKNIRQTFLNKHVLLWDWQQI